MTRSTKSPLRSYQSKGSIFCIPHRRNGKPFCLLSDLEHSAEASPAVIRMGPVVATETTDRASPFEPGGHRITVGPGMVGVQGAEGGKSFHLGVI